MTVMQTHVSFVVLQLTFLTLSRMIYSARLASDKRQQRLAGLRAYREPSTEVATSRRSTTNMETHRCSEVAADSVARAISCQTGCRLSPILCLGGMGQRESEDWFTGGKRPPPNADLELRGLGKEEMVKLF